jgi:hypothetical protein
MTTGRVIGDESPLRRTRHLLALKIALKIVLTSALALASPALAQHDPAPPGPPSDADRAISRQRDLIDVSPEKCRRDADKRNEIVVCADPRRNERERLPLRNESDAARSTRTGVTRAPDIDGIKCRRGADGVCRGNMGGAPPPIHYIDLSKIPEAPPGSDADRIAKGEVPVP